VGILLCSVLCFTLVSCQLSASAKEELISAVQRLGSKNTLEYGEKCSHADEIKRDDLQKLIINVVTSSDVRRINELAETINTLVRTSGQFCKAQKNVQCNSTGVCDCTNSDLMGLQIRSIRENETCRLASGSVCVPHELFPEMDGQKIDLRCQAKSKCVVKSNRKECTVQNMQEDIKKSIGNRDITQSDLVKDYCVCGAGILSPSHLFAILSGSLIFVVKYVM